MPLPSDEKIVAFGEKLIQQFDTIFGLHPGLRPAHAKGLLATGTFTPSPNARNLTRAPHVLRESTPVTVRFSNSTGIPLIPDNDPSADPRGLAIRFNLAETFTPISSVTRQTVSPPGPARSFSNFCKPLRQALHQTNHRRP
jgi:catalase